jgi:hypothetical protein
VTTVTRCRELSAGSLERAQKPAGRSCLNTNAPRLRLRFSSDLLDALALEHLDQRRAIDA